MYLVNENYEQQRVQSAVRIQLLYLSDVSNYVGSSQGADLV